MSLCNSQIIRLAAPDGSRLPSTQARTVQYGDPINAPNVAMGSPVSRQSETSICTDSSPVGSESRETLNASAPPRRNRRVFPNEESRKSHIRYGKLLGESSTIWPRYRRPSLELDEVAELLNSNALTGLDRRLRAPQAISTEDSTLVPEGSVEAALSGFESRIEASKAPEMQLMRLRMLSELLGAEIRSAAAELYMAHRTGLRGGRTKAMTDGAAHSTELRRYDESRQVSINNSYERAK